MKHPYIILTGLLASVFVYLVVTSVAERYSSTFTMYSNLKRRSGALVDPVGLPIERAALIAERDSLSSAILAEHSRYRQSQIGVIQCISDLARKYRVAVVSFSPGKEDTRGEFQYFPFDLILKAPFRRTGLFINHLENSTIPFEIKTAQIVSNPIGEPVLETNLRITASLYHGFVQKEH